ncbi:hypothetical protein GCM10027162_49690 [Streptomyces incanus]
MPAYPASTHPQLTPGGLPVAAEVDSPAVADGLDERHPPPRLRLDTRADKRGKRTGIGVVYRDAQMGAVQRDHERGRRPRPDVFDDIGDEFTDAELSGVSQFLQPPALQVRSQSPPQGGHLLGFG